MRFSTFAAGLVATLASFASAQIDVFNVPNSTIGQCEGLALMWHGTTATYLNIFDKKSSLVVPIADFPLSGNVYMWTANLAVGTEFKMTIEEDNSMATVVRWEGSGEEVDGSVFTVVEGNESCRLMEY